MGFAVPTAKGELQDAVRDVLRAATRGLSTQEVWEALYRSGRDVDLSALGATLARLVKSGRARREGKRQGKRSSITWHHAIPPSEERRVLHDAAVLVARSKRAQAIFKRYLDEESQAQAAKEEGVQ